MADADNPVGRSRARARGRARGQKPPEPARRPTDVIAITTPASQFPSVVRPPVAQPPQPAGAGRALHRGGVTSEGRSDGAAASTSAIQAITTGMEAVSVGQPGGRGAMRGRPPAKDEVHCRPPSCVDKRGTQGSPIDLLTNYVKVTSAFGADFIFYQYRVDFSPSIESSKMRRAMLFDHLDTIGRSFVFDGMEDLKTTTRLEKDEMILWSKRRTDDENIQITVKHTGELNGRHPEVLRLMNTQQRKNFLHMGFVAMGRNMFDKEAALPIEQYKIELWPGVLTAIRMYENSLLMVVDVIHKVVRMDTVLQQLRQHYARDKNNYLQNCSKELAGCIVMTSYNNKTYSLDDFDSTKCPTDTFETRKTGLISYVDYYKKQYDITIQDRQQPLIICRPKERDFRSGAKDPVYLIPELCVMTGLTDNMRSDFNLMREVAKTTRPGPRSRVEMLKSFMNRCLTNAKVKEDMEKWGISYGSEPLQLKGRVVPQEKIIQGRSEFTAKDGDFGKDMRSKPMHNPRHMDKFAMISTQRDRPNCEELYETFKRVCGPMKMNVAAPKIMSVSDDRTTSFLNAIKDAIKMGATLIVAIVPNNKADRYDAIKKLCCIECPVPSQVVVSRTLSKKNMLMSVATKIAIQINCKLGGEAWALTIPLKQRTMILGIDTYHDSSVKGRSVGGLVASMNELFTCWASRVTFHNNREELSSQLRANFVILLKKFHGINKDTPDLIIVYRDGLSDGELEYAKEYEVKQLLAAYADVTGGNKVPRFAFVVVNKRISTRFFTNGRGQYDNPPPGTIVDTEVTKPERYDFYLISQSIRQGTVSPTLFNIIEDTTGLKPDHMQRIAYKLTHMYFNWQGTIRVPAPCQYAHKLAFLVGQSLHREPADILCNQLFFL